jgi:putative transposase
MDPTFFITSVTAERRTLFEHATTADLLIDVFLHYRGQHKYQLHDLVVMPDHFHALITPVQEIPLERAVQFIKGGFSFQLKSISPVWQPGFTNHRIADDEDFENYREQIRTDPVRTGLVRNPEDYPYSSATGRFAIDAMPPGLKPLCHGLRTTA